MDRTAAFYAQPSYYVQRAGGGGLPVYSGSRRQRGGSVLGAISKFIMPFLGGVKRSAIQSAKRQAWGLAKDVAMDAFQGRNVGASLKTHGLRRAKQLGKDVVKGAFNRGAGAVSRKRAASSKRLRRPLKRRRKANF